jgi:hypothetical protein
MSLNPRNGSVRKIYPTHKQRPQIRQFADVVDVDSAKYQKQYSFGFFHRNNEENVLVYGVYEEFLLSFTLGETLKSFSFAEPFGGIPIVVASVDNSQENNVIPYITSISETSVDVGLSAPILGFVRVKAVYASSYPTLIHSGSTSILCTATSSFVSNFYQPEFSFTFPALSSTPTSVFTTMFGTNETDIYLSNISSGSNQLTCSFSAPIISSSINLIAFN